VKRSRDQRRADPRKRLRAATRIGPPVRLLAGAPYLAALPGAPTYAAPHPTQDAPTASPAIRLTVHGKQHQRHHAASPISATTATRCRWNPELDISEARNHSRIKPSGVYLLQMKPIRIYQTLTT
jgi:hypothetical protein